VTVLQRATGSFARDYEEFEGREVKLVGVSVDPPSHNAAMAKKLDLPFHLLSDPRGDLIKHCGLWNEKEGVSEPAIVALDGTVRSLYSGGTDFADRPQEESLLYILDRVGGDGESEGSEPEIRISVQREHASSDAGDVLMAGVPITAAGGASGRASRCRPDPGFGLLR
jgi:hypothetical protein